MTRESESNIFAGDVHFRYLQFRGKQKLKLLLLTTSCPKIQSRFFFSFVVIEKTCNLPLIPPWKTLISKFMTSPKSTNPESFPIITPYISPKLYLYVPIVDRALTSKLKRQKQDNNIIRNLKTFSLSFWKTLESLKSWGCFGGVCLLCKLLF